MKMKKVFKAVLSMALSVAMLAGVVPSVISDAAAASTATIPVVRNGELVSAAAERFVESSSNQAQNDMIMTETEVIYQIPQIKTSEYDLYTTIEQVEGDSRSWKTFRAADADGNIIENDKLENGGYKYFVVEKNLPATEPTEENVNTGAKAVLAERNDDGSLKLVDADDDGEADLSRAMGFVTAETYWNGYLFTAWSFPDSQGADYVTNLVVYDVNDMSEPVAAYNLRDLGMLYDWYHGEGLTKISSTGGWKRGTVIDKGYVRLNDWAAPTISGLYVDDDYLVIRHTNWSAWGGDNWDYAQANMPGGGQAGSIGIKLYANPVKTGEKQAANLLGNIKPYIGQAASEHVTIDMAGRAGENSANGKQSILQYNPNMTRVGNYIVEAYPYGARYFAYEITDSGLAKSKELKAADLNTLLGETAIATQKVYDADFDGTDMYLTYTDGTNWVVAKVDISDPVNPELSWKYDIPKTVTYPVDGETTASTTSMIWPRLDIGEDYGVLYDVGNYKGENTCSAKGNWNIILDMSDKSVAPTEKMRYDYAPARITEYGSYYNYGMEKLFGIAYDDYVVNVTSRYYTGKTGISFTRLNSDRTTVDTADMMVITDDKNYVMPNGFAEHDNKFFLYLKRNAVKDREASGKILVYDPVKLNEDVLYTVNFYNGDGSLMKAQTVKEGLAATAPEETPTKVSDSQHSYTFSHWDTDFSNVTKNLEIHPVFDEGDPIPTYTVTFYNGDGSVLETQTVEQGEAAKEPETAPTKADNGTTRYTFSKWDKDFSNIQGDLVVYPEFTESTITFKVKFCDKNSTALKEETIVKGNTATAPSYEAQSGYIFKGWALEGTLDVIDLSGYAIEKNSTFVPVVEYKVTFNDNNGGKLAEVESVGGIITPPKGPTPPEGKAFRGWAVEGTERLVNFAASVTPGTIFVPIYGDAKSIKIFTIGHSYGVNANWMLPRVLKEAGYTDITIGMIFSPGCSLATHWAQKNAEAVQYYKNTTGDPRDWKTVKDGVEYDFSGGTTSVGDIRTSLAKALVDEEWDIIVMQDSVSGAGRPEDSCYNNELGLMIDWINENKTNSDAKFAWHMLWANEQIHPQGNISDQQNFGGAFNCDEAVMYKGIIDTVQTKIVPNENFDYIIPSGTLMQNLRNTYFGNFVTGDSIHSDPQYGGYPIAMLWAEVLAGVDADTINYVPEPDEFQDTRSELNITDRYFDVIHDAINKTIAEPYKVTIDGPQKLFPRMSVDFGEPTKVGDNYKYTATVYLEQYGNLHGVAETGNYAGLKIKDWNLDVAFENASDLISVGTAASSLNTANGVAPDMSLGANGGTVKLVSATNGSADKAYPYNGIIRCHEAGKLALGTFEITTKTDNFKVNLEAALQYGNTYADGSFIEDASQTTYVTNGASDKYALLISNEVMVGQPEVVDNADDGLITSEAELRAVLSGTLSTDKNNPTQIVLGADIILDDGNATADDLTDGTLTIAGTSDAKVYVNISGNYTIKNMQSLKEAYILNMSNAIVNITDTTIDANFGNDKAYAETDKNYGATLMRITDNAEVTLNGTATLKNGYQPSGPPATVAYLGAYGVSGHLTINDNVLITGCMNYSQVGAATAMVYPEGGSTVTMNGGEVSGNVFAMRGFLHVDDNHGPTVTLNGGKIINNDTSKTAWVLASSNGGRLWLDGTNMTFDKNLITKIKINSDATIKITGPLTNNIQKYAQSNTFGSENVVIKCFEGDGYTLTLSDLQKMSVGAVNTGRYAGSRVMALNTKDNIVYSYLTIDDVPKGLILQDGTVVGEIVNRIAKVTENSGELTVSYELNAENTITGTPAAAIYSGDSLVGVTYDKDTTVSYTEDSNTGTINLAAPSDWATNKKDYTIKLFIWNPTTLAPQIDVVEYEAK